MHVAAITYGVTRARLPRQALAVLAPLRCTPGITVTFVDEHAWLEWSGSHDEVLDHVLPIAGVVLYDRAARLGGVAHIVLPDSRGSTDHLGKFADTAIPGMIEDLDGLRGRKVSGRLVAKIVGGASMFQAGPVMNIGRMNRDAVDQILADLGIPVLAVVSHASL